MRRAAGAFLIEVHQDVRRDAFRAFPVLPLRFGLEGAVTGEGELAAGRAGCALENHAAGRVRIAVVLHPVGDDFRHGELAFQRLAGRLVVHSLRHAHQFGIDGFGALDFFGAERGERQQRGTVTVAHRIAAHRGIGVTLQRVFDRAQPGRVEQGRRVCIGAHGKAGILIHREAFGFGAVFRLGPQAHLLVRNHRKRNGRGHSADGNHPATDEHFALFLIRHA